MTPAERYALEDMIGYARELLSERMEQWGKHYMDKQAAICADIERAQSVLDADGKSSIDSAPCPSEVWALSLGNRYPTQKRAQSVLDAPDHVPEVGNMVDALGSGAQWNAGLDMVRNGCAASIESYHASLNDPVVQAIIATLRQWRYEIERKVSANARAEAAEEDAREWHRECEHARMELKATKRDVEAAEAREAKAMRVIRLMEEMISTASAKLSYADEKDPDWGIVRDAIFVLRFDNYAINEARAALAGKGEGC